MQALVCEAIPVVLNEPTAVEFIHNQDLQDMLRVTSYEEGAALVERYDELLSLDLERKETFGFGTRSATCHLEQMVECDS